MGIHRISGSSSAVKQLRAAFASGTDVDLENEREDGRVDVHAVASLLRMYLRELTESLLTHQLEGQFAALVNASVPLTSSTPSTTPSLQDYVPRQLSNVHEGLLVQVSDLCSKLPRPNYIVLSSLFGHLSRVAAQEPLNKMGITNLQVVFAPSLGMPSALLGLFILHSTQIFQTQISSAAPSTTLDRNHGLPSGTLKRNVSLPAQYTVSPSTPKTISRLSSASNNPFDDLESEVPPTKPVRKQTLA